MKKLIFFLISLFYFSTTFADEKINFEKWKVQFKERAISNKISVKTFDLVMTNTKYLPKVIEYDRFQLNFMRIQKLMYLKEHLNLKLKKELSFIQIIKN